MKLSHTKKSVAVFTVAYHPHIWWAEVARREISKRVDEIERVFFCAKLDPSLPCVDTFEWSKIYRIWVWIPSLDKLLFLLFAPIIALFCHCRYRFKVSIGILAAWWWWAAMLFKMLTLNTVPYILNIQDGDTDEYIDKKVWSFKWFYKMLYRKPDVISVISKFLAVRAKTLGYHGEIRHIPNGVDTNKFAIHISESEGYQLLNWLWRNKENKVIITTSRLNYKNDIGSIIESLMYLDDNRVFLCLGEWELRSSLEKKINDLWLNQRVRMPWYVEHETVAKYMNIADVFCRPSLQEWLWNSFLEAMSFWIPVVATPVWWIVDFINDGITWFFCNVQDPKSIAIQIRRIVEMNENDKATVLSNAKNLVSERYTREIIANVYRDRLSPFMVK